MVKVIEPKVNVVDYGPKVVDKKGKVIITPDEFTYGAAGITYKDVGALNELMELKQSDKDISEKIKISLIKSAGAGHASMATTPGMWIFLEGNCSKLVDSVFTGARFASSLMPSGRRIPITKEQIVIPKNIHILGGEIEKNYVKSIENCIDVYEKLQEKGVPKQEAAKIVPYGHRGGGFMFMPLETLISYSKDFERNRANIPLEAREIVSQLENFVHSYGMSITYEARKAAPRTGCPNPSIFHREKNLAQKIIERGGRVLKSPIILSENYIESEERDIRIDEFLEHKELIFLDPKRIPIDWKYLLNELEEIVQDYNNSVQITTATNSPWRVWGEVKRHRTLPQITESVYNAIERAIELQKNMPQRVDNGVSYEDWPQVVSVPKEVKDVENFQLWINTFRDSLMTYNILKKYGVEESDAIEIIPRGLKMGIVKTFDLYNLTTGYMSLRLCNTAEPEMRATTEEERKLILNSENAPESIKRLIEPKCSYIGFCPDRYCGKVNEYVPDYNRDFHKKIQLAREEEIRKVL